MYNQFKNSIAEKAGLSFRRQIVQYRPEYNFPILVEDAYCLLITFTFTCTHTHAFLPENGWKSILSSTGQTINRSNLYVSNKLGNQLRCLCRWYLHIFFLCWIVQLFWKEVSWNAFICILSSNRWIARDQIETIHSIDAILLLCWNFVAIPIFWPNSTEQNNMLAA